MKLHSIFWFRIARLTGPAHAIQACVLERILPPGQSVGVAAVDVLVAYFPS
jgi:hypothetical protein